MSEKQSLLQAVGALPENATWSEITQALLTLLARRGLVADYASLYKSQLSADHLAEYANPQGDLRLDDVIAELEPRHPS